MHKNWLCFFAVMWHLHIPYALRCLCIYSYNFLLHMQHKHCSTHSTWTKIFPFRGFLNELLHHESLNFTQYLFLFDGVGSELSAIFFAIFWFFSRQRFYFVKIGKSSLNENKIQSSRLGSMDIEQTFWKLKDIWRFKYRISINCMSFWKS